ncbi:hypothetical protein ACIP2Y_27280 [Streptomyces sviceus]
MRVLTVEDKPYPAEVIRDSVPSGDETADPQPEAGSEEGADRG